MEHENNNITKSSIQNYTEKCSISVSNQTFECQNEEEKENKK